MTEPQDGPLTRKVQFETDPIDGQGVKELVIAGTTWLETNQEIVNSLNVFPVPDGDTGTNMMLTMRSALEEILNSAERHAGKMLGSVAHGALMGARGNSGVILSQLWRGMALALEGEETMTTQTLIKALNQASATAYKGVVRPVEGTILTVSKDVAAGVNEVQDSVKTPVDVLAAAVTAAAASVERTPELLPILKEAGVVDSGGKGYFFLLEGMLRYIEGMPLDTPLDEVRSMSQLQFDSTMSEVEEGQDYEVVVDFKPSKVLNLESFFSELETMGTSIQVGEWEDMYRMHIHVPTEKLYTPIDYCMELGTITNVAIENLMAQMEEIEARSKVEVPPIEVGQIAVVAVAPGQGIARVFASLGVAALIEGGQTMNPSTQDILGAFEDLPTDKIVILPNNKNIIMAAEAAAELTVKQIKVIKSRTVPQGLAAMLKLSPMGDFEEVTTNMEKAMGDVETGELTIATRDVELDGVPVKDGQHIGLHNGKLVTAADSLEDGMDSLLERIGAADYELLTLFYGSDVKAAEAEAMAAHIAERYPDIEVEVQEGGQPHYHYIFSIE